jgi:hypothetical protein
MIFKITDDDDRIIAYTECWQVGPSGLPKYMGEYLWIQDIWVHPKYEHQGYIVRMIDDILKAGSELEYCYWTREKYNGRKSKTYTRQQFLKLVKRTEA